MCRLLSRLTPNILLFLGSCKHKESRRQSSQRKFPLEVLGDNLGILGLTEFIIFHICRIFKRKMKAFVLPLLFSLFLRLCDIWNYSPPTNPSDSAEIGENLWNPARGQVFKIIDLVHFFFMCMVFAEQMPVWDFYTALKYKGKWQCETYTWSEKETSKQAYALKCILFLLDLVSIIV